MSRRGRTGSKLKTTILLLMVPTGFIMALNLFWLGYSTTRVTIKGHGLASVTLHAGNDVIDLGNLRRGESRFMFLPKAESMFYSISYMDDDLKHTVCALDIAGTRHHVEAKLYGKDEASCEDEEPIFSDLMVRKFF